MPQTVLVKNEKHHERRARERREGICTACEWRKARPGMTSCEKCAADQRRYAAHRDPQKVKAWARREIQKRKLKALQLVSGLEVPKCTGCGCEDIRVLEANHKNHDGGVERKKLGFRHIYRDITMGRRSVEDLDVKCRICNELYSMEHRFGLKWSVRFGGDQ